jgi:hypothetical protein
LFTSSPTEGSTLISSEKYIGLDVHQATISVAVMDSAGRTVMECNLETKAATTLQFIAGIRGTTRQLSQTGVPRREKVRVLRELAGSYLTIVKDLTRVMNSPESHEG